MNQDPTFVWIALEIMATLFIFSVGTVLLVFLVLFVIDLHQRQDAIRHNYPVIGRFRDLFQHLGKFFRQYFFAFDREEMPFNRADREWVYRAAQDLPTTSAFGSTRDLRPTGTVLFVNCPYPVLGRDAAPTGPMTIGPACPQPYTTRRLFHISGMSFGAISRPAVLALSQGARLAGCWLNTGEGGLSPHHLAGGADLVFQIGTAKYGVRDSEGRLSDARLREVASIPRVKMFEIKLSQGAKPGKGGLLPGAKVTAEIAEIRGIPVGEDSVSPNRHPEIDSAADLLDMVEHVRMVTGKPVGFKTVIGAYGWLEELFDLINKRGEASAPDFITIDSADGGTGAAPASLMDYVGLPVRETLPLVVDLLSAFGLRERIRVIASGKLVQPGEVAWALAAGADFAVSARGFMLALGCIQAMQCDRNTCPTGITTHDRRLQSGLDPDLKAVRVRNYANRIEQEVGMIAHSCGVREPRQLRRFHARIVTADGLSVPLDRYYGQAAHRDAMVRAVEQGRERA